jgi:hypothetical protein
VTLNQLGRVGSMRDLAERKFFQLNMGTMRSSRQG